jgi:hypothetical protein
LKPHGPKQTLVWTPEMDPRHKQEKPTQSSQSSPVKVAVPKKAVATRSTHLPHTAELPPTRLKTIQDPPASLAEPPASVNPKKAVRAAAKAAKEQRRLDTLKVAADIGISENYARLVMSGEWTPEYARQRYRFEEYRKEKLQARQEKLQARQAREPQVEVLLKQWVDQNSDLVRLTDRGPLMAHLLQVDKYEWLWDDQAGPQPKLETFAVITQDHSRRWSSQWQIDVQLEAQGLQVPPYYPLRRKIAAWKLEKAHRERLACQVVLYNGLEIEGFVAELNEFSLEFVQSLEEKDAPRLFVWRHGIYAFWIFTEPVVDIGIEEA